jgi:hypothetical protein
MASGHVNRINRPNTWLHRPSLRREDSPCQLGAVHTWPFATFRWAAELGRYQSRADMAQLAAGSTRSGMTRHRHSRRGLLLCKTVIRPSSNWRGFLLSLPVLRSDPRHVLPP